MTDARDRLTLGLVQMSCGSEPSRNLDKAITQVEDAARRGAQVVCLQELFRSQYPCQVEDPKFFDLAEPIPGPSTAALGKIAAARKVVVVASLFERRAAGVYHNTAVVIGSKRDLIGHYPQTHIPHDPPHFQQSSF